MKKRYINIKELKRKLPKLENVILGKHKIQGQYIMFENCPFCNHKNHFVIDKNRNEYHSFSGCVEDGSIIDWYIKKEGKTWKDIFEMVDNDIPKVDINKKKEAKNKEQIIEHEFNYLYDNLISTYKILKKIELNRFGKCILKFVDIWSNEFIKSENKEEIINSYKSDVSVFKKYILSSI